MSLFYVYVYVLYELFFIHNVVRMLSCVKTCKNVRLSCVFYNKLTYLLLVVFQCHIKYAAVSSSHKV